MVRNLIIAAILTAAVISQAADKKYYEFPNATRLRDDSRVLVFDTLSGSRNLTGSALKAAILPQPLATPDTPSFNSVVILGSTDGTSRYQLYVDAAGNLGTLKLSSNPLPPYAGQIYVDGSGNIYTNINGLWWGTQ